MMEGMGTCSMVVLAREGDHEGGEGLGQGPSESAMRVGEAGYE
jgi:hypothetical protein